MESYNYNRCSRSHVQILEESSPLKQLLVSFMYIHKVICNKGAISCTITQRCSVTIWVPWCFTGQLSCLCTYIMPLYIMPHGLTQWLQYINLYLLATPSYIGILTKFMQSQSVTYDMTRPDTVIIILLLKQTIESQPMNTF